MHRPSRVHPWAAASFLAFTFAAAPALAEDAEPADAPAAEEAEAPAAKPAASIPTNRVFLNSKESLRYNPIGLQSENKLFFQHRLMDSESALFRDTWVSLGLYNRLSPAFITAGPHIGIQPIAILTIDAGMEFNKYFGNFDQILSWDDPSADYHDDTQDLRGDAGENYATTGYHAFIRPSFQMKGGPVVVKTAFSFEYWNMNLQDSDGDGEVDDLFYDFTADMLVPNLGWTMLNDTDLLYFTPKRMIVGARYSSVVPMYKAANYDSGVDEEVVNSQHRAGIIAIMPLGKRPKYSAFHSQALIAILSYYIKHDSRGPSADASLNAPEPPIYFAFVYTFTSDFLKD